MYYINYHHLPLFHQWHFDYVNVVNVLNSVEKEEQITTFIWKFLKTIDANMPLKVLRYYESIVDRIEEIDCLLKELI